MLESLLKTHVKIYSLFGVVEKCVGIGDCGLLKIKMAAVHEQVLKELCFICGCILRGTVYDVDKFKENLENAFNFNFDIVTGVTPMFFLQYLLSLFSKLNVFELLQMNYFMF